MNEQERILAALAMYQTYKFVTDRPELIDKMYAEDIFFRYDEAAPSISMLLGMPLEVVMAGVENLHEENKLDAKSENDEE